MTTELPGAVVPDMAVAEGAAPNPSEATPPRPEYSESMFAVMLGQYAVMQMVVAATALVRNKVIAVRLGPSAFGEIAQMAAVVASVVAITAFGMQVSLSRNVARATTQAERQAYLASANGLVLGLSLVATAALALFLVAGNLLNVVGLPVTSEVMVATGIFFAAIPLLGLQTNFLAFLQGLLDVRGLATQRSLAVLIATGLCVPLVWVFGLIGAATTFLILNALLTLLLGLRCRALGYGWLAVRLDRRVIGVLAGFGLVSMIAGFAQTFADAAIRASLLKELGPDANGLLQAPLVLAATLQVIVLGSIGTMSLASVSQTQSKEEARRTIDRLLNVALPMSTAALGLLGLLGVPVLYAFYSEQFTTSAGLLPWILCADLVVVVAWVVGAPLLAFGDRAIWLVLELVWAAARWAFSIALLPVYGAAAVGMGMFLAVVLHVGLIIVMIGYRHDLRVSWRYGLKLLAGLGLVALVSVIGANWTASIPALMGAAVLWLAFAAYVARSTPVLGRVRAALPRR